MGDVVSLVEKAAETIEQDEAEALAKKIQKGQFDLEDMLKQLRQLKKMGGLDGLLGMLPGIGKMKKQLDQANIDPKLLKRQEAIILSMTPKERRNPKIIHASRKKRIAGGSGATVQEINKLLKQWMEMSKMMKRMGKMAKKGKMPGGMPPGGIPPGLPPGGLPPGGFPPGFPPGGMSAALIRRARTSNCLTTKNFRETRTSHTGDPPTMSLRIRLARGGAKKRPYYRIVIADSRTPRDGRFIERVGSYNPMVPKDHPDRVKLNEDRIKHWLGHGAQPSDRVARFLGAANIIELAERREQTKQHMPRPKTVERMKAAEEAKKAAEEARRPRRSAAPAEEAPAEEAPAEEAAGSRGAAVGGGAG